MIDGEPVAAEGEEVAFSAVPPGGSNEPASVTIVARASNRKEVVNRRLMIFIGLFVVAVLLAVLISLMFHWYFSIYRLGQPRLKYNHKKMSKLQPKLIGRVKGLWEMANRSVHEVEAREYLRNLSRNDRSTCYSALCVHTGEKN